MITEAKKMNQSQNGETTMSAQEQARSLMNRHQHAVKNRQQSMLSRSAAEIGVPTETPKADSDRNR